MILTLSSNLLSTTTIHKIHKFFIYLFAHSFFPNADFDIPKYTDVLA